MRSDDVLTTWSKAITARIAGKVADARAHGEKAVTETLRQTPDGRPTVRLAHRSRSVVAAQARLAELLADLVGPGPWSREGMIQNAYADLYRAAVAQWKPLIPEDLRAPLFDLHPTAANVTKARALSLHGMTPCRELNGVFLSVRQRLVAAVALAASPSAFAGGIDRLAAWELAARTGLTRTAVLLLGDAEIALDHQAGLDLIRPELIDRTPLEVD